MASTAKAGRKIAAYWRSMVDQIVWRSANKLSRSEAMDLHAEALAAANGYQAGFDLRAMRQSRLGACGVDGLALISSVNLTLTFHLLDWAGGGITIAVNPTKRRVWTNFVEGAGAGY